MPTAKIGDREITLPRFTGYKALRAGVIVSEISTVVPLVIDRLADFRRDYTEKHELRITREDARMPQYASRDGKPYFTDEDFERAGGDVIIVRPSPSAEEQFAVVFGLAFDSARRHVVELLALMIADNAELEAADEESDEAADEYLRKTGKRLLHESSVGQLLELGFASAEMLKEEFAATEDPAGKLLAMLGLMSAEASETENDSPASEAPSSIASPEPTDGTSAPSSTVSAGADSSPSASG